LDEEEEEKVGVGSECNITKNFIHPRLVNHIKLATKPLKKL
jgi:hypothetical protein